MAIRFQRVLPLAALAAMLATGTAVAAQDNHDACCAPQIKSMSAPLAKAGARDPYTDGAKSGTRDPYTDGGKTGARDPYTDGAAQAVLDARVGARDPYTDGSLSSPRSPDPYTDGAIA
ncbi:MULTISPECIES: hypothetical protein [Ralstonia]|uniref:Uncharacterized protein n=1 Tax=Ralstonia holmesii TaxID=3058602 RepID=A0ABC8QGL6_9RALS|nr:MULTISPECIES: hypothetical protein [unclassified Ralstonia]CAJ0801058.1 hypothetical protein LMG18096_03927 [Ralstonia sp. LMG 32967]CAJ0811684.1 hypothetical protein LMG18093_01436 [Ralstonia sp. LMG 32967]